MTEATGQAKIITLGILCKPPPNKPSSFTLQYFMSLKLSKENRIINQCLLIDYPAGLE